jgi:hypothetical protein
MPLMVDPVSRLSPGVKSAACQLTACIWKPAVAVYWFCLV